MLDQIGVIGYPLVTGHRGAGGERKENTLDAFAHAAEIGCDGVELDVHLSKDGIPVVAHEPAVHLPGTRNGGDAILRSLTRDEIREIDPSIPTLRDVFDLLEPTMLYMQVELKGEGVESAVLQLVREFHLEGRAVLTSFVHQRVLTAKTILPEVRTGVLLASVPVKVLDVAHHAHADNIHLDHRRITKQVVERVHAAGKTIVAWGIIGDEGQFDRLFDLGVDIIGSDWPTRLLARRRERFGS